MSSAEGARGPYRKGLERRREILAAAAELFAESGYTHSSMRELAKRVNLTQPGVLHHFSDKSELLVEVLNLRDASVADHLSSIQADDIVIRSREIARHAAENAGLTSLFITLSAEAINADHPAHQYFVDHYRATEDDPHEWPQEEAPSPPDQLDEKTIAILTAALQDGLQIQRRYKPELDVVGTIDAFWQLVAAARAHAGDDESADRAEDLSQSARV